MALERNELIVYYQPRQNINNGKIIGVDALVRWIHPTRGMIPPQPAEQIEKLVSINTRVD